MFHSKLHSIFHAWTESPENSHLRDFIAFNAMNHVDIQELRGDDSLQDMPFDLLGQIAGYCQEFYFDKRQKGDYATNRCTLYNTQ